MGQWAMGEEGAWEVLRDSEEVIGSRSLDVVLEALRTPTESLLGFQRTPWRSPRDPSPGQARGPRALGAACGGLRETMRNPWQAQGEREG